MAAGFFRLGMANQEAVYHYFFRRPPFSGGFTVTAGLESLISFIRNFKYQPDEIDYLRSLKTNNDKPLFDEDFLSYLKNFKIELDIDAAPEGSVVFPYEPIARVRGPMLQAQLLETPLLNLLNFPTLIATKASRMVLAARGDPVVEFGLRRAQGVDGALTASRSAYVGGVTSTSNVQAGKCFGIPVSGTQAHSWILSFDEEIEAFRAFAKVYPDQTTILVDTFDTHEGIKKAIEVGKELKKTGKDLYAIRLDSGDLANLSEWARDELDRAGLKNTLIIASNELDEWLISELKRQGAKISCWGIGTNLSTGGGQGALDGVYKLSAIRSPSGEWQYKLKLSEQLQKISNPGFLQVKRYFNRSGKPVADLIYDEWIGVNEEPILCDLTDPTRHKRLSRQLSSKSILEPIFRGGECVYTSPPLKEIRELAKKNLEIFPNEIKRFVNPHLFTVGFEQKYHELKLSLIEAIRSHRMELS